MKKYHFLMLYTVLFSLLLITFAGCKKSAETAVAGDSYMRYKLNGTKKDYNFCSATFLSAVNGIYSTGIAGANSNDPSNDFSITLFSKTPLSQGATFTAALVPATYFTQGQLAYVQSSKGYTSAGTVINPAAKVSVIITELSSTYVKGTFSGTLYSDADNYTTVVYTVTEGEFNAKR
ncbi:MAG: hypothetical protein ABUT20_47400 [Bacteroidota bacterium]